MSLAAEVARTYLALRGAERQHAIVVSDLETQEQLARLVASRYGVGLADDAELSGQRAQVASTRAERRPLEQDIAQDRNRLALLLAQPPGAIDAIVGAAEPPALPPSLPVSLPGELLRRRPDIRRSEAQVEAATARIGVAKASLFPTVRLGLSAGLQATRMADLTDWASRFFLGGAQVSLPIFDGGRLRGQLRVADLQAQEAVLAYRQTVLSAFHDVDNALIAYAGEQARAADLLQQRDQAVRRRDLTQNRYAHGLASFIDVLDAERSAHQAEVSLAQSATAASTNLVALFKALGGGWSEE